MRRARPDTTVCGGYPTVLAILASRVLQRIVHRDGRAPGTPRGPGDPKGPREALHSRPATTLDGWPDGRVSLGGRMAGWAGVSYL